MTTRERLIELLRVVPARDGLASIGISIRTAAAIADHLIASGVTVQGIEERVTEYGFGYAQGYSDCEAQYRWIPASEPPQKTGSTLISTKNGAVCTAKFYADGGHWNGYAGKNAAYWMPLPQPPKGVE